MPIPTPTTPSLSRRSLITGALGGAALLALPAGRAGAAGDPTALIVARLNEIRVSQGLAPLHLDPRLGEVSAAWSARMAGGVGLAHNPDHRGQYGWPTERAGEVVGFARTPAASPDQMAMTIVDAWMQSSGHRAAILGGAWTDMGVGVAQSPEGRLYATANFIATALPAAAAEALALSGELIPDGGADRIVLARTDLPADALAGSPLTGGRSPLLLVRPGQPLPDVITAEIGRISRPGTIAYLLGGGLHSGAEQQVQAVGAITARLTGGSRYETAAMAAAEAARAITTPWRVHLIRADAWADAVSVAGQAAYHAAPLLMLDHDGVPDSTRWFLDTVPGADRVVIGGGVTDAVVQAVGGRRIAGTDRSATGVEVMRQLWGRTTGAADDHFLVCPGWTADGWATALAHSSWAATHAAPLLLASGTVPAPVRQALEGAGYASAASGRTRFSRHVPEPAQSEFRALIGG